MTCPFDPESSPALVSPLRALHQLLFRVLLGCRLRTICGDGAAVLDDERLLSGPLL